VVDGYQTGDWYLYPYEHKQNPITLTDTNEMTVHRGKMDIFNLSRKPGGKNPEIRSFMRKCFEFKDKYADIVNKGTFIVLDKQNDKDDQVIAFARHYQGRTLLVVANKNVNESSVCKISIPGLKAGQELKNLLPSYGEKSRFKAADGELKAEIGAARVHVFEINTPYIEHDTRQIYRQSF
jgi:hypothetical protein